MTHDIVRKQIESTYIGTCTVVEHRKVTNQETKLTDYEDVPVLEGQPCRLSFEKIPAASQNGAAVSITQITKLFIPPDISISPGSKIIVTQNNITTEYTCSGVPAVYPTHQEIILGLFERWA